MATDTTQAWGTNSLAFTCTFHSLTNTSMRETTVIDLTGITSILDLQIMLFAQTAAGSLATTPLINLYVFGSIDGSTYPATLTGADAAYSGSVANLIPIRPLRIASANTLVAGVPQSLAQVFGGSLPAKIGLVVENLSGLTLDTNAAHNKILYRAIYAHTA